MFQNLRWITEHDVQSDFNLTYNGYLAGRGSGATYQQLKIIHRN